MRGKDEREVDEGEMREENERERQAITVIVSSP